MWYSRNHCHLLRVRKATGFPSSDKRSAFISRTPLLDAQQNRLHSYEAGSFFSILRDYRIVNRLVFMVGLRPSIDIYLGANNAGVQAADNSEVAFGWPR